MITVVPRRACAWRGNGNFALEALSAGFAPFTTVKFKSCKAFNIEMSDFTL